MAWSQTEIDSLKSAIASGVRTVAYADKTVTYHSMADMLTALAAMEAEVSGGSGGSRSTFVSLRRD